MYSKTTLAFVTRALATGAVYGCVENSEVEFSNSELSLIKSSPLPAHYPAAQARDELTPLDSSAPGMVHKSRLWNFNVISVIRMNEISYHSLLTFRSWGKILTNNVMVMHRKWNVGEAEKQ